MQTKKSTNKFAKVSLVLSAALLIVAATAAPAFADDPLIVDYIALTQLQVQPQIGDGGAFEMAPVEGGPIMDAGDWEMCPVDEEPVVDAGEEAPCPEDEPQLPEGGQEVTETVPSGDEDEVAEEPQGNEETPDSNEQTETPEPEKPEEPSDEPRLPFTGGNGTPFTLAGIALAVAGAGYLIRKRHVFGRD